MSSHRCGLSLLTMVRLVWAVAYSPTASGQDCLTWARVSAGGPDARDKHGMAYDVDRGVTVLFSGKAGWGPRFEDTWEWDGTQWEQRATGGPESRIYPAMAYDCAHCVTVLFGGFSAGVFLDDTWEWDGAQWKQRVVDGPSGRFCGAMVYDAAEEVVIYFGGTNWYDDPPFDETWAWDGDQWTLRAVKGPGGRWGHAMAYDAARGVTVLFGGVLSNDYGPSVGDTWEWDGESWTLRATTGPEPRSCHAMVYDAARGVTVLFGVEDDYDTQGDTWEWDGTEWTQRDIAQPEPRYNHQMVYDAARGRIVLFGGYDWLGPYLYGDTWELGLRVCPGDAECDGDTDHGDLGVLLSAWGSQPGDPSWNEDADLDGDGHVGHSDLGVLLGDWGCGT